MLNVKEREEIAKVMESLDNESVYTQVVDTVSSGLHFSCYPERKAFWDSIRTSMALRTLISKATEQYVRLYLTQGYGRNKYANFLKA